MFSVLVKAKIHPSSKKFKLEAKDGVLHVWLTEPAEQNKANIQLVKKLTHIYGSCRIVRGLSSKNKTLELPPDWESRLNSYFGQ